MESDKSSKASRIKLARACRHRNELDLMFAEYVRKYELEDTVSAEVFQDGVQFSIKWTMRVLPLDEEFGAVVGDIVHNLRAALDLLACAAARNHCGEAKGVYFPFAHSKEDFASQIRAKKFEKAGPIALEILQNFRPYRGGNDMLRALHDLDIRDKHQQLIPQHTSVASPVIKMGDADDPTIRLVGNDKRPSEVTLRFPADWPMGGEEVLSSLDSMIDIVSSVIEAFEPCLAEIEDDPAIM